ncbi:MAG: hypothetical protein RAK24_04955 [TACK group archaeon]|nr:hypothetical protein [TACK group archaeon]
MTEQLMREKATGAGHDGNAEPGRGRREGQEKMERGRKEGKRERRTERVNAEKREKERGEEEA